jgi:YD repeat-containing protein
LESITDPKGQMILWDRDVQSRPTRKFYPDFSQTAYTYESKLSRLKEVLDAAGKKATFAYNADNTLKQLTFSGGTATPGVTNTYDTNYTRLSKMADGIGTTSIGYMPLTQPGGGNVQSITNPLPNSIINLGYDAIGRVQSIQIAGVGASVQRDDLGRIYWSSNALGVTSVSYDGATQRPLSVAQPSGITTVLAYTAVSDGSRLQTVVHTNGNGLILSFGYVYDVLGRIIQMTETRTSATNVWAYQYDLVGQLTAATQREGNGTVLHR